MIGRITAAEAAVAGGVREAAQAGPGGIAESGE